MSRTIQRAGILMLLVVSLGLSACTTRIGDLTILSTKNIPAEMTVIREGVEGKDCANIILLLIPIGTLNPTIDGAIDDALDKVPGADAMIDITIKQNAWTAILFTQSCVTVKGTAISPR